MTKMNDVRMVSALKRRGPILLPRMGRLAWHCVIYSGSTGFYKRSCCSPGGRVVLAHVKQREWLPQAVDLGSSLDLEADAAIEGNGPLVLFVHVDACRSQFT